MTGPQDPRYPGPSDPQYGPAYPPQGPYQPYQQYGPGPYQHYGQYGPQPNPYQQPAPRPGLLERLGARAVARPVPRLGVSITGVGVALVVLGILVWGATYLGEGVASGSGASGADSRRFLGFGLTLVVVAIGYVLIVRAKHGPLVTAGIAATALGVPVAMEFLTVDVAGGDPVNVDAVVWVSVIIYLITYLFVPIARGHAFYLGLALLLVWEYVLVKAGPSTSSISSFVLPQITGNGGGGRSIDSSTLAGISLVFGLAYYLAAWALDHTGRRGMAVAFVVVGLPAVLAGILSFIPDLKQLGTGVLLLGFGLLLAWYGARYGRRFTTWFWAFASAAGAVVIATKFATQGTSIGITMIVLGVAFVVAGWLLASALREGDDMIVDAPAPVLQGVPVR
jgi:hypothetical protein